MQKLRPVFFSSLKATDQLEKKEKTERPPDFHHHLEIKIMETANTTPEIDDDMDATTTLLTTYNELNSPAIDTLTEPPSALEFMRFVAKNRPFVVRRGALDWEAVKTWDVGVLKGLLEGESVNVAVTPRGYVLLSRVLVSI